MVKGFYKAALNIALILLFLRLLYSPLRRLHANEARAKTANMKNKHGGSILSHDCYLKRCVKTV